jgi:hypothetical protein
MERATDILTVIKRLRMHGICINFLMSMPTRNISASLADKRPLDHVKTSNKYTGFD